MSLPMLRKILVLLAAVLAMATMVTIPALAQGGFDVLIEFGGDDESEVVTDVDQEGGAGGTQDVDQDSAQDSTATGATFAAEQQADCAGGGCAAVLSQYNAGDVVSQNVSDQSAEQYQYAPGGDAQFDVVE